MPIDAGAVFDARPWGGLWPMAAANLSPGGCSLIPAKDPLFLHIVYLLCA